MQLAQAEQRPIQSQSTLRFSLSFASQLLMVLRSDPVELWTSQESPPLMDIDGDPGLHENGVSPC